MEMDKEERSDKEKHREGRSDRDKEKDKERSSRSDRDKEKEKSSRSSRDDKDKDKERSSRRRSRSRSSRKDKERDDKDKEKEKSSSSRSSRRDKDKDRDDKDKDREKDREKEKEKEKDKKSSRSRRSRSRSPRKSRSSRSRSRSRSAKRKEREAERQKRKEEDERKRKEREEREAHRDEYTVFVTSIHPKIDERDLFEFFSYVGQVEDIRLIKDQRTNRSKGLAYIEFWEKSSVTTALALSGQLLGGYPITVQIAQTAKPKPVASSTDNLRLYVGNLHVNVADGDLRPIFEAFGDVESIDLQKDSAGNSRGFGFVQYKNAEDAKNALQALNGLEIAGQPIKVGMGAQNLSGDVHNLHLDDDEGGGIGFGQVSRADLMAKLQRQTTPIPALAPAPVVSVPMIQPTTCVVIKNMFDPKEETEPEWDLDIRDDVSEECEKFAPQALQHIFVDKNSLGHVYLRFKDVPSATGAVNQFNGRWFSKRQIAVDYLSEQVYMGKFPQAK